MRRVRRRAEPHEVLVLAYPGPPTSHRTVIYLFPFSQLPPSHGKTPWLGGADEEEGGEQGRRGAGRCRRGHRCHRRQDRRSPHAMVHPTVGDHGRCCGHDKLGFFSKTAKVPVTRRVGLGIGKIWLSTRPRPCPSWRVPRRRTWLIPRRSLSMNYVENGAKWGLVLLFWVLCNAEENGTSGSSFRYNVECRYGNYYVATIAYVQLFAN